MLHSLELNTKSVEHSAVVVELLNHEIAAFEIRSIELSNRHKMFLTFHSLKLNIIETRGTP